MASYNSGRIYNRRTANGGATYNSAPFLIVVLDNGYGIDGINSLFASLSFADGALSSDTIALIADVNVTDQSNSTIDSISITANVNIPDYCISNDVVSLQSSIPISDSAAGIDNVSIVDAFFVIDSNNILQPLGVKVLRDSRVELLPSTRDNTEEIPGMHGEIDFGTEFKARNLELHVVTNNSYTPLEKAQLQRLFAKYLDPTKGTKTLIFADDIEKTYVVKFSGKIDPTTYATWFEFTLPFKMSNPFIKGSFERIHTGSGTLINDGTFETPIVIEITGPVTNPSVTIGTKILSYTGTIPNGQVLVIDTKTGTVKLNGVNAMAGFSGELPLFLQPGSTSVTASGNVMFKWHDCWL